MEHENESYTNSTRLLLTTGYEFHILYHLFLVRRPDVFLNERKTKTNNLVIKALQQRQLIAIYTSLHTTRPPRQAK